MYFDYDSRYIIGDAREDNIMEIWNNERMQEFRKAIVERRYHDLEKPGYPLCTECSQVWPVTPEIATTTRLPEDFVKEVTSFFSSEKNAFKAKYTDIATKGEKLTIF